MTSFLVLLNIEHSGKAYSPGEEISGLSEKEARQLVEVGAIHDESGAYAKDVTPEESTDHQDEEDAELKPEVGGVERPASGEQSVDVQGDGAETNAKDVTPEVQTTE